MLQRYRSQTNDHHSRTGRFTGGIIVHHPCHIACADADTGLTPSLPKLPSGTVIATWKPGDTIHTPTHDQVGHADENPGP